MSVSDGVLIIVVLIISVVIHENAHGWVALWLGDRTAKSAGRLTLNPIPHIDPLGSIILPAMMAFTTGSAFGYAKPVPVNPRNLKGTDRGGFAVVAVAGPVSNIILAFLAAVALRWVGVGGSPLTVKLLIMMFDVNVLLAAFNVIPIPPLDGSRVLRLFLSPGGRQTLDRIEPFGFVILLLILVFLEQPFFRIISLIREGIVRLLPI